METNNTSILGVLSGKDSIKIDVGIDLKSIAIVGVTIFFTVLMSVVIAKKVS